jgi:exodeoxyribonuclease V
VTAKIIRGPFPGVETDPSNEFLRADGSSENKAKYNTAAPVFNDSVPLLWSADQDRALIAIKRWLQTSEPLFKLWGYAGTGKSTLLAHLAKDIPGVVVLTPTNKAAAVLRAKGITAQTIHAYCYAFEGTEIGLLRQKIDQLLQAPAIDRAELRELEARLQRLIAEAARRGLRPTGEQYFGERDPEERPRLIIVDEASMVSGEHAERILSFGVKTLPIGDPFQLPPVPKKGQLPSPDDAPPFVAGRPDAMLSKIHRQAEGSPIIRASLAIREFGMLALRQERNENGAVNIVDDGVTDESLAVEQIIVGRHATRIELNSRVRALRGFDSETPMRGERLVSRSNVPDIDLCNGEILIVERSYGAARNEDGDMIWTGAVRKETGNPEAFSIETDLRLLRSSAGDGIAPEDDRLGGYPDLNYGYAITCHSAQGSQWESAAVIDESFCWKGNERCRWLYTAVTRAAKELTVVYRPRPPRKGSRR